MPFLAVRLGECLILVNGIHVAADRVLGKADLGRALYLQQQLMGLYEQNIYIDIVARGVYEGQQRTRDKAVRDSQAWPLAFSEEGKAFVRGRAWTGGVAQFVEWLAETYPFKFRSDPIPSWRRRIAKLRADRNPHAVLRHYHSFMLETTKLRGAIMESAGAAEAEIEVAVDRFRGK
jgi:hypothetical protein